MKLPTYFERYLINFRTFLIILVFAKKISIFYTLIDSAGLLIFGGYTMENQLLEEHHVLILGALKRCHISQTHPSCEDHLQNARWTLIETHRRFVKEDKSMETFNGYVFQRIFWKTTDTIRKDINYTDHLQTGEEDDLIADIPDTRQEDLLEIKDILEKLKDVLTDNEKIYLEEVYINDASITEISRKYKVSRQTVYKWRDKVALKTIRYLK